MHEYHSALRNFHAVRRMRCTPLAVSMIPLMVPTTRLKLVSSKGFCISPREKWPRSPPLECELQSDSVLASSANLVASSSPWSCWSCCWKTSSFSIASSLERVMFSCGTALLDVLNSQLCRVDGPLSRKRLGGSRGA